jgi:hypothetical protein
MWTTNWKWATKMFTVNPGMPKASRFLQVCPQPFFMVTMNGPTQRYPKARIASKIHDRSLALSLHLHGSQWRR